MNISSTEFSQSLQSTSDRNYAQTETVFFERQMVIFNLGSEEFGVDISDVREIIKYSDVTKVPATDDCVDGIINLRGNIVVIVDLAKKINMPSAQRTKHTRVIIIEVTGSTIGFVVDRCSEVIRITGDKIHSPPQMISSKISGEYISSVGILGSRIIIIMDLAKVMSEGDLKSLSGQLGVQNSDLSSNSAANSIISSPNNSIGGSSSEGSNSASSSGVVRSNNSSSLGSKGILIVEDSTLMRSTLKSFIPKNIVIEEAADGEQALNLFKNNIQKIGLVLLDIKLPGMNGIEVLKELLALKPGLNVVMETSVYDDTTKDTCLKIGAKDYLKKPVNKHQIEEVIAKYSS